MRFGAAQRLAPAAKPQTSGFRVGCEALAADASYPARVLYLVGPSCLEDYSSVIKRRMRFGAAQRLAPAAKPQTSGFRVGCEALAADASYPARVLYLVGPSCLEDYSALLNEGINFIEAISSHPHINGGLAEPSLQDLSPG
jgi:hypothetical protein